MLNMLVTAALALLPSPAEDVDFNTYFLDKVLRIDIHQIGTAGEERICIDALKEEPFYAGPKKRLVEDGGLGSYRYQAFDASSGALIYSRGFCTLFGEWRTTEEARRGIYRVFDHTLIMPFPRNAFELAVSKRKQDNSGFVEIFRQAITPDQRRVRSDNPYRDCMTVKIQYSGNPSEKVDIVILGDGYRASEMKKYLRAARNAADNLFAESPFKECKKKFNIWAVECPSPESGVDEPGKGIYKSTVLGTSFNTFDLAHYSLTMHVHDVWDVAACVPYDAIIILFNAPRYGGGGLYNLYAMVSGSDAGGAGVVQHEVGHALAGLADEYYTSQVTYIDFYPDGVEPWEPNITALLEPGLVKWAVHVTRGLPIPTPNDAKYSGDVGCFEGAGYRAKGLYRPCRNCIMLSCRGGFCPVCKQAIQRVIDFHTR
jgi:hypothetical protein